ncbi:recombinase family protein (plasmid) [Fusobacteria bacterium ZRK30]|nr:recombinase family protein [Fusobacteria bacterium ZRK30]
MKRVYGYVRISTKKQSITRQIENISKYDITATIIEETFTGTTTNRPRWIKLKNQLKLGDTVIFDSVSRMSRNAAEGIDEYEELVNKGIKLIFLKEAYINSEVYQSQLEGYKNIHTEDKDLEPLFRGIKETLKNLARKQIIIAFNQSEKEVQDLRQRTKEALAIKKAHGIQLGHGKKKLITKKSIERKEKIQKMSKRYMGNMNDKEVIETIGMARHSFYKYIREINN